MGNSIRAYSVIISVLFLIFLCSPMVYKAFDISEEITISKWENRYLAPKPVIDITYLDIFPEQYAAYYDDHFPLREEIINLFGGNIQYRFFGKSPVPEKVTIGSDGWMYQAENRLIYSGESDFTPEEVETMYRKLHDRAQDLASQGIDFYFTIAPMKCEIYQDQLPYYYKRTPSNTRTDKLIARLSEDTLIRFIDSKKALLRVKDSIKTYQKTDQHWSSEGGFIVYKEIMLNLKRSFPGLRVLHDTDLTPIIDSSWCGGLTIMARLAPDVSEMDFNYIVKRPRAYLSADEKYTPPVGFPYPGEYEIRLYVPDTTLPSILVIRDSFTNQTKVYLAESFEHSIFIFDNWQYQLHQDIITIEKPDIVLLEIYEPLLHHLLVNP